MNMAKLITEMEFEKEVMQADVPVVVDFFATWCAPCKMIAPILDELDSDFGGKAKIVKVDVDQARATAKAYGVRGVPTLLFFKDGEIVDRASGVLPKAELAGRITPWL